MRLLRRALPVAFAVTVSAVAAAVLAQDAPPSSPASVVSSVLPAESPLSVSPSSPPSHSLDSTTAPPSPVVYAGDPHETESEVTEHFFKPFEVSAAHIIYCGFGAFVVLFACFSLFIKEKMYLGEAPLAAIFGIIVGPYCLNIFDPSEWGNQAEKRPPGSHTTDEISLEILRVTIALSVFAAGVELPKKYMLRHWQSISILLGPVMLFGWLVTGLFLWAFVPGLDYLTSLVVAAAVTPTDPILSASVVGGPWAEKHVPAHIRHLLMCESGCNDGAAFPFLYLALYLTMNRHDVGWAIGRWVYQIILYEIVLGTIIGSVIGWVARKIIRLSEHWRLVDRESFVVHYVALALLSIGANVLLGSDDLLAAFAAGTAFAWDGWFTRQTEDSNFSAIVDLLFNTATFVYLGAMMPFGAWVDPITTLNIWRLFVITILTILFKRIPILIALWKYIPDIKTFRDALFVGHFGPMGCGAIFIATFGRTLLPEYVPDPPTHANDFLANSMIPITYFFVLCSIAVHGLTVPFFSAARNSTKRLHKTLSHGGLAGPTLSLSHTATWDSWAGRAFQRFKTSGSEKPSHRLTSGDTKEDEGGMAEIRRVLASQLQKDPTPEDVDEAVAERRSRDHRYQEDEDEEGSNTVDANSSPKNIKFAQTPTTDSQKMQRVKTGPNQMHPRTISFARNDSVDDIEDAAADEDMDPGGGDWATGENDAETRRIRQHAYLTGETPLSFSRVPSFPRHIFSDRESRDESNRSGLQSHDYGTGTAHRLKFVGQRIAGSAGAAVQRIGTLVHPGSSRDTSSPPTEGRGPRPLQHIREYEARDLQQQNEEEEHAEKESEQRSIEAEAEVDRPSMDPEEENEDQGNEVHYPTVHEWVEGSNLVLEYMESPNAEPDVCVIQLSKDDEESWKDEHRTARELGQSEPSPAWRWACDHRTELESLLPDSNITAWTPHNARFELIKHDVPAQLAKRRKELGLAGRSSSFSKSDKAQHSTSHGLFSRRRSSSIRRPLNHRRSDSHRSEGESSEQNRRRVLHRDSEEDEQADAVYRAQVLLAGQEGVGANQDQVGDQYDSEAGHASVPPHTGLGTAGGHTRPPSASQGMRVRSLPQRTASENDTAEGDLGLSHPSLHEDADERSAMPSLHKRNLHSPPSDSGRGLSTGQTADEPHDDTREGIVYLDESPHQGQGPSSPPTPQQKRPYRVHHVRHNGSGSDLP